MNLIDPVQSFQLARYKKNIIIIFLFHKRFNPCTMSPERKDEQRCTGWKTLCIFLKRSLKLLESL